MNRQVEAIYEGGVLRPLEPLVLQEHQQVTALISESVPTPERAYQDMAYAADLKKSHQSYGAIPSIDEILQLTGKDNSSWADAIATGREERF